MTAVPSVLQLVHQSHPQPSCPHQPPSACLHHSTRNSINTSHPLRLHNVFLLHRPYAQTHTLLSQFSVLASSVNQESDQFVWSMYVVPLFHSAGNDDMGFIFFMCFFRLMKSLYTLICGSWIGTIFADYCVLYFYLVTNTFSSSILDSVAFFHYISWFCSSLGSRCALHKGPHK